MKRRPIVCYSCSQPLSSFSVLLALRTADVAVAATPRFVFVDLAISFDTPPCETGGVQTAKAQ